MKKAIFYISLIAFLILINSGALSFLLDNVLGFTWSSPITDFLEKNSQGFLVVFLLALFWDFFYKGSSEQSNKISTMLSKIVNILEQCDIKHSNLNKVIEKKIQEHYGIVTNVSNLIDIVISQKNLHSGVNVSYKLRNLESDNKYSLRYQYSFVTSDDEFYIAFLTSSDLQDQLSASSNVFFDMFVFSDLGGMDENIKRMKDEGFYIKSITEKDGMTMEKKAHFKKIPKTSYSQILPSWFDNTSSDISIYKASFDILEKKPTRYIYTQVYTMDVSDNYCYWVSDRTLFLQKFKIDLEEFLDTDAKFTFQPFMANSIRLDSMNNIGQSMYDLNVNNWVVKGQGVLIIWRR